MPEDPVSIDADATRLAQALGNLFSNASKFTHPGGQVAVTLERDSKEAIIRVRDTGIGIAADQLPRVFDMFMQGDSSLERSHTGLGLGLTLVKQLVEAHGGTVAASSDGLGLGREFTLRLPLPEGPAALAGSAESVQSVEPVARSSAQRRVLVVDDNHDGAESLAIALAFHMATTCARRTGAWVSAPCLIVTCGFCASPGPKKLSRRV